MRSFGSDNHSGVHPAILEAIAACNADHEIAYGDDTYTARLREHFKAQFGETAEVFPVFNGTGANVVAQRACVRSFNSILCAETAHIAVDECGAPAFMTGAALVSIPTPDGKLTPQLIEPHLTNWASSTTRNPSPSIFRNVRNSAQSTPAKRSALSPTSSTRSACTCISTVHVSPMQQ